MPRGRHAAKGKTEKAAPIAVAFQETVTKPHFRALEKTSPLLTLLFSSKEAQHAALSRIEAFYESSSGSQRYLTLDEAKRERICQHYEAFNFPISVVREWLRCMRQRHAAIEPQGEEQEGDDQGEPWWKAYCNVHERHLLDNLTQLGISLVEGETPDDTALKTPVYLISTLESKRAALQHERLHFLYYISADYQAKVLVEYLNLSAKTRKIVETDLTMRKYSSTVWMDEFQAYISEDAAEFGKSIQVECQQVQATLRSLQGKLWKSLNL